MVRSIVALLVPGVASESVLMQNSANADAVFALAGLSRVDKMKESTKAMEEQYKGLLENIVKSGSMQDPNTGTPWLPSAQFFTVVQTQFDALKEELKSEKRTNEGLLRDAKAAVVKCNTERKTDFDKTGGVLELLGTMQGLRADHKTCRSEEDTKIVDMTAKCKAFDDIEAKCDEDQDWYAKYDGDEGDDPLKEIVTKATDCKLAVDDTTAKAAECDTAQGDFEASYCTYAKSLKSVCDTHSSCYTTGESNHNKLKKSVDALEKEQKAIWRMVGKVECYLKVLLDATVTAMPTQDDINTCSSTPIDDSPLSIDDALDTIAPKDACMNNGALGNDPNDLATASFRPGFESWYNAEYTGSLLDHDKLNEDSSC